MNDINLAHLHPAIRNIALADDEARLQAIRSKRWVTHDPASRVLACLTEAFEQPRSDRMENLLLVAEIRHGQNDVDAEISPRQSQVSGIIAV